MPVTVEIDTNDEFIWAERTTDEITLFGRTMTTVTTLYDDGHTEETYSINGTLISEDIQDPTDVFDFASKFSRYDTSGELQFIDTLGDDGQRKVQNFADGVLDTIVLTDETGTADSPGAKPWDSITLTFDANGDLDERVINYDSNTGYALPATDTQGTNFLYEIQYDADNLNDWLFIDNSRSGTTNVITTYYDHGGVKEEIFRNGLADRINEDDYGNAESWTERTTVFDANGAIATRFTFNDDGSDLVESYVDEVLSRTTYKDNDSSNSVISVSTFFDTEGNAVSRDTLYTNNETVTEILRATTVQTDDADTANWSQITTVRDGEGALIERETVFDNGNTRFESFENGVLSERLTTEADGDLNLITYEDGQRATSVRTDVSDSKSWDVITTTYDENGDMSGKTTSYDNGILRVEAFEDGLRTTTTQTDTLDAKNWNSIETVFDENGQISQRVTIKDNGIRKEDVFENGARAATIETDVFDFVGWDVKMTAYDENGKVGQRATLFDNGDEMYRLYDNGQLLGRLDLDGNDSNSWEARLIEYLPDGPVTTTYDNPLELPEPYLGFLDIAVA